MIYRICDAQRRSRLLDEPNPPPAARDACVPQRKIAYRAARIGAAAVVFGFAIITCDSSPNTIDSANDITSSVRVSAANMPVPKRAGYFRIGNPYVIGGRTYVPREQPNYSAEGIASWYGGKFHGRMTANGEIYDMNAISAAHPTLPLPSYLRVTNLQNRRSIVVRLNDRGPYFGNRLIDMSIGAAKLLGFYEQGLVRVRVDYIGPAKLEGSNDKLLAKTLRFNDILALDVSETASVGAAQRASAHGLEDNLGVTAAPPRTTLIEIPH